MDKQIAEEILGGNIELPLDLQCNGHCVESICGEVKYYYIDRCIYCGKILYLRSNRLDNEE